jgi:serine/threonine protein kinase
VVDEPDTVHLVEELAAGGELFDRIIELGSFTEQDACLLIKQVFEGIAYMHSIGAVHRDLKPENLLMVSADPDDPNYKQLKIADFGLSSLRPNAATSQDPRKLKEAEEEYQKQMSSFCGTPDYLAPEVLNIYIEGPKCKKTYDAKVDVWSIGVIFYIMICGYPPFWSENYIDMVNQIRKAQYEFGSPAWDDVTDETKKFITELLEKEPEKRPTAQEALDHPRLADSAALTSMNTTALGNEGRLGKYLANRRGKRVVKAIKLIGAMRGRVNLSKQDPLHKEAVQLFRSIDALGNKNGTIELFEILLYVQEYLQHLFVKEDTLGDGEEEIDEEKVKQFADFVIHEIDENKDGKISMDEFVFGYAAWRQCVQAEVS